MQAAAMVGPLKQASLSLSPLSLFWCLSSDAAACAWAGWAAAIFYQSGECGGLHIAQWRPAAG